jgi:site-specific recombinase XerD
MKEKIQQIEQWERLYQSGEEHPPDGNMSVAEFYNTVFLPYTRANKEAATSKSYERYWNAYLKDHFNGTKTLNSYAPYQGTNFLEQCARKYSVNTVMHIRAIASAIFSYATAKGYIKANPWRDVKLTVRGQEMEDGYAYSVKEIELILEALERVTGREEYSAKMAGMVIAVCFWAGLRPSEAAGLKWENVSADTITGSCQESCVTSRNHCRVFPRAYSCAVNIDSGWTSRHSGMLQETIEGGRGCYSQEASASQTSLWTC